MKLSEISVSLLVVAFVGVIVGLLSTWGIEGTPLMGTLSLIVASVFGVAGVVIGLVSVGRRK
jgi:hypothetical protein